MQAAEGEIHPRMGNRQDRGRSIGIRKHRIRWYAAASFAALLCLLGLYIYGPFQKNEFSSSVVASVPQQQDVDPGGNRATLTRSEERRVGKECVGTVRSWWTTYH